MSQQPLRTVAETAKLLGVSESTVWVLIRGSNPQLASIEIKSPTGSRKRVARRIEQSEIDAHIERERAMLQDTRSIAEAVALLGVSESTIWALLRGTHPQLPSVELRSAKGIRARERRIKQSEIDAFIARNRVGTPAAAAVAS